MTSPLRLLSCVLAAALCIHAATAAEPQRLRIGYLELEDDPRYAERTAYARIRLRAASRAWPGAEVALAESAVTGDIMGLDFELLRHRGADADALRQRIEQWHDAGIRFVLLDLPGAVQAELAAATRDRELLLFNVSAPDDALRGEHCAPHLLHSFPSHAMQADALVQYLVSKDWRRLLLLEGPDAADRLFAAAVARAAERFGARIAERRNFRPGNDPRHREETNIALLTANADYDVVVVADSEGEFGRYVPYQTRHPRPVAGTTGLEARAWSRVFERHGAPQVNDRFQKHAGRHMDDSDWAAWVAVKSIVQAALRTKSAAFDALADYLRGAQLRVDGAKGPALRYREWNGQLRQPLLLATHDAVIARAPIEGFLHPRETMDTLGHDVGDNQCEM